MLNSRRYRFSRLSGFGKSFLKCFKGEIQGQSLAIDVDIFDDDGKTLKAGEKGELVVKKPFPSMPIKFWDDDKKMRNTLKLILVNFLISGITVIL